MCHPTWRPCRRAAALALAPMLLAAACGGAPELGVPSPPRDGFQPAANAAPPAPPSPTPAVSLYGRVFEHSGAGAVSRAGLAVVVTGADPISGRFVTVRVVSGAGGEYRADVNRGVVHGVQVGAAAEYVLPCLPFYLDPRSNEPFDLHVASPAVLSAIGPLSSMSGRYPMVAGMVFENAAQGVQPIGGALIEHFFLEYPESIGATVTGPDGRYEACAYDVWDAQSLRVTRQGYRTATRPIAGTRPGVPWDGSVELVRE